MFKSKDVGAGIGSAENYSFGQWTGMGLCVLMTFLGLAALLYVTLPACRVPARALGGLLQ